jgi:X-Pro dipeptidyl-peptidase
MGSLAGRGARRGAGRKRVTIAVAAAMVASLGISVAPQIANAAPAPKPAPAEPTFKDGMAQSVFGSSSTALRAEAWVEVEGVDTDGDGKWDRVHIDISRPLETDQGYKAPVIMEMSPYYAGTANAKNWNVDHELGEPPASRAWTEPNRKTTSPKISSTFESVWLPRGFAVVHAEALGTGMSTGCSAVGDHNEIAGGKAVIDWLNGRAKAYTSVDGNVELPAAATWTTGKTAMIGTSYNGTLPTGIAATGVQGLEAIVPISAISTWYDYYRANGMVKGCGGCNGEDLDVLGEYIYSRPDRQICRATIANLVAIQDRVTGDYSPVWDDRNYLKNVKNMHAAVLIAHGFGDWNVQTSHAVQLWEELKKYNIPRQLYFHRGGHGGSPNDTMLNLWFTRYLFGVQNGVEDMPKAYIVRQGTTSTIDTYADWPVPGTQDVKYNFNPGGKTAGGLTFAASSAGNTKETLVDNSALTVTTMVGAASSDNRLVYKSEPLKEPLRINGTPLLDLTMAFDRSSANLSAALVSYPATGNPVIVSRGWMDPQNRNSLSVTEPMVPGEFYKLHFNMQPQDYVFPAGARVGIAIMSSDRDYTIRPPAGRELTLDLAKSSVTLPTLGGLPQAIASMGNSTGQTAPNGGYQVITAEVLPGTLSMEVTSSLVTMPTVTLNGYDQTVSGALNDVRVGDARGTSAGWSLTGQVSDFVSSNGLILADNLGWAPSASVVVGTLPVPASAPPATVNAGDAATPGTGTGLANARSLCSSPAGASAGGFTCGGGLTLGVPGSTRAGTYTGVLTLTLV